MSTLAGRHSFARPCGFAIGLCALLVDGTAARAAVRVDVKFVIVDIEVSPRQETHISDKNWGTSFTLNGEEVTRHNGDVVVTAKLNQAFNVVLPDVTILTSYRIHGGVITETEVTPHARRTIDIRTNGVDSCSARVVFWKKPGNKLFVFNRSSNGETMFVSDRHAERVTCTISRSE